MSKGALKIEDKPIPANMTAWTAFHMLRGSRQIGYGGVSPIPFSEIMAYCTHAGVDDPMERQQVAKFVMALDRTEREEYGNNKSKS
ncbi:MAG: phage tail assembly chaperone [Paracoccaceae bacterium]|jgi:hypothetical protein